MSELSLVGQEVPEWGEAVIAFVVPLPKNSTGKVLKTELRKLL